MDTITNSLLIDGDEILYKAGFSSQKTYYRLFNGDSPTPVVDFDFPGYKYAVNYLPEIEHIRLESDTRLKKNHSYKEYVGNTIRGMLKISKKEDYVVFFSEGINYRYKIAKLLPYKGNRTEARKPILLPEIREWVMANHPIKIVQNIEVDDALGLYQNETNVISTQDKDLNGVPGWRIGGSGPEDLGKELRNISEQQALLFFYCQLLSGDSTDNIPGIVGMGLRKAYKYYDKMCKKPYTEKELYHAALLAYGDAWLDEKKGKHLTEDRCIESQILEIGQLLWMQRRGREIWQPMK